MGPPYVVDSDVFITAKNLYYAFDICPSFWKSLIRCHEAKSVVSIDRVRSELLAGDSEEDLVKWVKDDVPQSFFKPVDSPGIVDAYTKIMLWVQHHQDFLDQA